MITYTIEFVNLIRSPPPSPTHTHIHSLISFLYIRHMDKIRALLFFFSMSSYYRMFFFLNPFHFTINNKTTCIYMHILNACQCRQVSFNFMFTLLTDRSLWCCINIYQSYMHLTGEFLQRKTDYNINITLQCFIAVLY